MSLPLKIWISRSIVISLARATMADMSPRHGRIQARPVPTQASTSTERAGRPSARLPPWTAPSDNSEELAPSLSAQGDGRQASPAGYVRALSGEDMPFPNNNSIGRAPGRPLLECDDLRRHDVQSFPVIVRRCRPVFSVAHAATARGGINRGRSPLCGIIPRSMVPLPFRLRELLALQRVRLTCLLVDGSLPPSPARGAPVKPLGARVSASTSSRRCRGPPPNPRLRRGGRRVLETRPRTAM